MIRNLIKKEDRGKNLRSLRANYPKGRLARLNPNKTAPPAIQRKRVPFKKRTMKNLTEIKPDGNT